MLERIQRTKRPLTAVAMAGLIALAGMSAPTPAEGPPRINTYNCRVYFKDLPSNQATFARCGTVVVVVKRALIVTCSGSGPFPICWAFANDSMHGWWTTVPGETQLVSQAFTVNPGTCHPTLGYYSGDPECSIGYSGNEGYVQMISITSTAQ